VNAILLIVGLGLLAGTSPPLAPEGTPEPAARGPAAPEPLPQLQAPGLPPAPDWPPARPETAPPGGAPLRPEKTTAPALAPLKKVTPAPDPPPARPPAFRRVTSDPQPEHSSLRPQIPEPHPAAPLLPPAGLPSVQTPTVALDKNGPKAVRAGEPFRYEIVLRNVGPVPAARVLLEDQLPPGTQVLAAQPVPLAQDGRLGWQIEGLAPGEEKRFRVEVQTAHGGEWKGTATVMVCAYRTLEASAAGPAVPPAPPASAPPPVAPAPEPQRQVEIDLRGPGQAVLGHPVGFELRVTNRGAVPLADLVLRAHLPPGLEHIYGSEIELGLDPLGPGESRTETLEVIAAEPGRHAVEVTVRAGGIRPAAARAEVTVTDDPVLTVRLLGPREGATDREHPYRIEVTNRTGVLLRDVVVLERMPQGVDLSGGVPGGSFDRASRTVRWALGNLAAGQSRAVSFKLQTRATGPALNDILVRTGQGYQAGLRTVLKFWPPRAQGAR
jgi:uncharacterized repeat protein (TIGR01451 family)